MSPGDYASVATARAKEVRFRLGSGVFIAVATCVFTDTVIPALIWFAALVAAQIIDHTLSVPIRRHPELEPRTSVKAAYGLSIAFSAAVFSSIAVFNWSAGGDAGKVFAALVPAGAVLAMSIRFGGIRRVLIAGWAPHALYILAIPISSAFITPEDDLWKMSLLTMGGLLFLAQVLVAVARIDRGAKALRLARDEADQSREQAERASAAKSDFLATISHEIRTPMNAVAAAADLLRRTPLSPEQSEHVDILSNATEVLMGLLNDVLDISKIESGKLEREFAEFDLVQKLELGVQLWRPRAAQKGVHLQFQSDGLPQRIVTDPLRLQQIVFNLLSNAVKFTDTGCVELRGGCSADGKTLWLEVEDSGCGMDAETCERIFASFEQATAKTARQYGGTGLGLAISRRLAELLGGALTVRSERGHGSVFRLETPLIEARPARPVAAPAEVTPLASADGIEVLLAEDHPVNQRIVRLILEPMGCRITVAADGAEAVVAAAGHSFDVILMDMQMPVMGGVEATERIRSGDGPNAATPIIALTANAMTEHRDEWAAVGVHRFAPKPVNMQALIDVVMEAAAESRARSAPPASVAA
jgi:signal transduction histidine kinase/AmiR/NasT family two-component response regulator